MWIYEKRLLYPVNIKCDDLRLAGMLAAQYGGEDGELSSAISYLTQRFGMPNDRCRAILNDIGTEESAHPACH